jgi:hypothetical protein
VVTLRAAGGDELLADRNRKWKIGKPASMQMAKLSSSDTELETTETMRRGNDTVPRGDFARDLRRKRICHATTSLKHQLTAYTIRFAF